MNVFRVNYRKKATLIVRLEDLFPQCSKLQESSPRLTNLMCLAGPDCHVGNRCMETLAWRICALWECFPDAQLVLVAFRRHKDGTGSIIAGKFWKDDVSPELSVFNPWSFKRLMMHGTVFSVTHPMLKAPAPKVELAQAIQIGTKP